MRPPGDLADELVAEAAGARPIRSGSLLITVFGDAVAPRGGSIGVSSLARIVEPLGVNDSLVRTSLSRLSAEGWFDRARSGRKSYYRLSAAGQERFDEATGRIYAVDPEPWDGRWRIVLVPGRGDGDGSDELRRELGWLGFGALAPSTLVHPNPDPVALAHLLRRVDRSAGGDPLLLEAAVVAPGPAASAGLVDHAWRLDDTAARYRAFLDRFSPVYDALRADPDLDPRRALLLRVLLVHRYRQAVLRDPRLPPQLLPPDWSGRRAQQLCAATYRLVVGPAETWLDEHAEGEHGPLPPPGPAFAARFGGLDVSRQA